MPSKQYTPEQKTKIAQRVTLIGMVLDIVLGTLKIIVGFFSHSAALVADGVHSFSDVLTDIMVLAVTRYSRQAPDDEHPYGHERFETLGTVFLGSTLIAVAGAMAWDSLIRLFSGNAEISVGAWALAAAFLSIIGKEWIFRYTLKEAEKINSKLLVANAWHSRTDAISSVVVLIALLGSMIGLTWLDAVAACAVGFIIARIGWNLAWDSIKVLVDTAPSPEETEGFMNVIMATPGVKSVHSLRSRLMGDEILLDVHLQVAPSISVSEGHQIGLVVCKNLRKSFKNVKDITYHIDAEDDAKLSKSKKPLPLRAEVLPLLKEKWKTIVDLDQCSVRLHYLQNKIQIELYLPASIVGAISFGEPLKPKLVEASQGLDWLDDIQIWAEAN